MNGTLHNTSIDKGQKIATVNYEAAVLGNVQAANSATHPLLWSSKAHNPRFFCNIYQDQSVLSNGKHGHVIVDGAYEAASRSLKLS